jgi:RimJ/RimL family protein N-acetyltransferase
MMTLEPLLIDEDPSKEIFANAYCQEIFQSYPAYYHKVGYHLPWIGYWVMREGRVVGVGGFVSKPDEGKVEIAYGTNKEFERQGVASFTCKTLILIAWQNDPGLLITAKTEPRQNASTTVLKRSGFKYAGVVQDDGIGDAWLWLLKPQS